MKKVLIVGPCYADAILIKKFLNSNFSVETMEVTKAEQAKNILRQRKIDLVLASRILAGDRSSGIELVNSLKKSNPEIPSILLTRFPESQKEALESGAAASFDMDLMIGYIRPSMKQEYERMQDVLRRFIQ